MLPHTKNTTSQQEQVAQELALAYQKIAALEHKLNERVPQDCSATSCRVEYQQDRERELRKSEQMFRITFEQVAVGMAHTAPDGKWLRVNQRLCEITGYSKNELMSKLFQDISHPVDLVEDLHYWEKTLRGEIDTYTLQKRYFRKDGGIVWVKSTTTLIRTTTGTPDYFVNVIEDITQLKETEQQLIQSEKRYRQIVEAQEDAICRFRADFQLTFANPHYAQLVYGKRAEDIIGTNLLETIPTPYKEQFFNVSQSLTPQNDSARVEIPILAEDNQQYWVEWNHRALFDESGQVVEYQVVGRDTTQRRQIENAERGQRLYAEALRDSLAALTESRDVEQIMQQILSYALTVVPSEASSIFLFEGNTARIAYLHGYSDQANISLKNYRFPIEHVKFQRLISTQLPYNISDIAQDQEWISVEGTSWIRSAVGVPIVIRNEVIGVLHVDSATLNRFRSEEILKLQDFARHASLALEHAYYVDQLEARVKERTAELEQYAEEIDDLYNNAPCGYHSLDKDGYFVRINDTELNWLGYHREEVIGILKFSDLCTPQGVEDFRIYFPLLQEQGWVNNIEYDLIRKDGSTMRVLLSATSIYRHDGSYVKSRSMLYDITPLKQAQESVRQQRDLLQLIIDTLPNAIILKDEVGRYEMVNKYSAMFYDLTPEEMVGKTDAEVHQKLDEVAIFAEQDRIVRESGKTLFVPNNVVSNRYFQTTVIPLDKCSGKKNHILVVSNDVTELKRAEMALSEQRDFLDQIVNNIPSIILVKDKDGHFQLVNQYLADLYKATPEEILGKTDSDLNPNNEEVTFYLEKDREALNSGQTVYILEEYVLGRLYKTTKIPLCNSQGSYDRLLVVATDITEHKQAEKLLQQALAKEKEVSELRNRFISMTSHEFRTPLTAILATAETLSVYRSKLSDEQVDRRLEKIAEQVNYLKEIMEDVLKLSRVQAQYAELHPTEFDLNLYCQQLIDELRSEFVVPHQISYHCDEALKQAKLDKKLFSHIINNLLSNAAKYSPSEKPISLTMTREGEALILKVSDQGIGIPENDLPHLFEPFHRASNVGSIAGTGLGLTIAKESVERHGGELTVESTLGIGTTFRVKIPL